MVKCLPAMREIWVRSLGWEDSLEKEMATHSSTRAWKIPWTEEPGVQGVTKSQTRLSDFTCINNLDFIMVVLASQNELGSVLSSSMFWKSLRKTGVNSLLNVW